MPTKTFAEDSAASSLPPIEEEKQPEAVIEPAIEAEEEKKAVVEPVVG